MFSYHLIFKEASEKKNMVNFMPRDFARIKTD